MTTSDEVLHALDGLRESASRSELHVRTISPDVRFRVCRTPGAGLGLVIGGSAPTGTPDTALRYLRTYVNAPVLVTEGETTRNEVVCLVDVTGSAAEHERVFAGVAAAVVDAVRADSSPTAIAHVIDQLVEMFAPPASQTRSVLGIWGEMVFMLEQPETARWVRAWHVAPEDLHDFASSGHRVEVKTTQASTRIHEFEARQLARVDGVNIEVASLVTTRTDAGTALVELVEEASTRLGGDFELRSKLYRVIAQTLGLDWVHEAANYAWDRDQAVDSIRRIGIEDLPTIEGVSHPRVVGVRVRVDCDGLGDSALSGLGASAS